MVHCEATKRDGHAVLVLDGELVGDRPTQELHDALEDHYVDDGVTETTGTVDSVRFTATGPVLAVSGREVPLSNVVTVASPGTHPA